MKSTHVSWRVRRRLAALPARTRSIAGQCQNQQVLVGPGFHCLQFARSVSFACFSRILELPCASVCLPLPAHPTVVVSFQKTSLPPLQSPHQSFRYPLQKIIGRRGVAPLGSGGDWGALGSKGNQLQVIRHTETAHEALHTLHLALLRLHVSHVYDKDLRSTAESEYKYQAANERLGPFIYGDPWTKLLEKLIQVQTIYDEMRPVVEELSPSGRTAVAPKQGLGLTIDNASAKMPRHSKVLLGF